MFEVKPFSPEHVDELRGSAAETWIRPLLNAKNITATGYDWSGFWNGRLVGCAGFVSIYPQPVRAVAWAILTPLARDCFGHVHRAVKQAIAEAPFNRIEANVDLRLDAGHRWAKALGFRLETPFKALWLPDGRPVSEYVITR